MTATDAVPADTVTLPRIEYERLKGYGACWELWWSPAAIAYRAEEAERLYRQRIRTASWDLSAAIDWSNPAMVPIDYRELQRRRYPWLHDPTWRCRHSRRHDKCPACATGNGPRHWQTGELLDARKDDAA
jgi:hypothetical protein